MKITTEVNESIHIRDVETYEDVCDLMHNIIRIWSSDDPNWRGK